MCQCVSVQVCKVSSCYLLLWIISFQITKMLWRRSRCVSVWVCKVSSCHLLLFLLLGRKRRRNFLFSTDWLGIGLQITKKNFRKNIEIWIELKMMEDIDKWNYFDRRRRGAVNSGTSSLMTLPHLYVNL